MPIPSELARSLARSVPRYEAALRAHLDGLEHRYTPALLEAIRYTPLAGGKRLRPFVAEAWATACGGAPRADVDALAVALELVHACSLVLDDLPSMDDAGLRRGRPSCHREYGEATAILAANAQLMEAFAVLGELDARRPGLGATARMSRAVGVRGMVGGQHVDLELPAGERDLRALEYIHRHKTGVLFEAAAVLGVRLGGGDAAAQEVASVYARNLGLAFQVRDDLLDATGHAADMGKDPQQDRGKPTFVATLGQEESERIMHELLAASRRALGRWPRPLPELAALCQYVAERDA